MNSNERHRAWVIQVRMRRKFVIKIQNRMKWFFMRQNDDVHKKLLSYYRRQRKSIAKGGFNIRQVFDIDEWINKLDNEMQELVKEAVVELGQVYAGEGFNADTPVVRNAVGQYAGWVAREVNLTSSKKLEQTLIEGMANNESIRKLTYRVKEVFDEAIGKRALVIARTTAFAATNMGAQHGMEQGEWERKMWLTSRDARVRPSHQIDGQVVPVDKPFVLNDGRTMMYPMDINERCVHIATTEPVTVEQYT